MKTNCTDVFQWGERHRQILLLFLCMLIAYALRVNLSVGIVAMTDKSSANKDFIVSIYIIITYNQVTSCTYKIINVYFQELPWNESTKSTVLSSFFWGYLIIQIYAGQMAQKYGAKYFLVAALGISGVLTIITPATAIHGGSVAMCVNRMIQGMAQVCQNLIFIKFE